MRKEQLQYKTDYILEIQDIRSEVILLNKIDEKWSEGKASTINNSMPDLLFGLVQSISFNQEFFGNMLEVVLVII